MVGKEGLKLPLIFILSDYLLTNKSANYMPKKLIISEEQLEEIINGTPYLADKGTDNGMAPNAYSNEIVTAGNVDNPRPATGQEIGKNMGAATNNWGIGGGRRGTIVHGYNAGVGMPVAALEETYTKKDFEAKMLAEMNSQLNGINMTATQMNPVNPANPMVIQGKETSLAKRKTEAKQNGDVEQYKAVSKALDAQRNMVKQRKQTNQALGMPNQFQKAGGTKDQSGTAHTAKDSSPLKDLYGTK